MIKEIEQKYDMWADDYNLNPQDVEWLIKQAERVRELEVWYHSYHKEAKLNNILKIQNKRYREALEFYAEQDNYRWEISYRPQQEIDCMVIDDGGHTARKALGGRIVMSKERMGEHTHIAVKKDEYKKLKEQAERVEGLEKKLSINTNNMKQLQKQNQYYKQALEEIRCLYPLRNVGYQVSEIRKIVIKALEGEK